MPRPFRDQDGRLSEVVEALRARLEEASLSLSGMEEERERLERQVEAREGEIARLGRQIGSDSNLEKVRRVSIRGPRATTSLLVAPRLKPREA